MGTGHVMRMIALGQAWQDSGGAVRFLGDLTPLAGRLTAEGFAVLPIPAVCPDTEDLNALLAATRPGDWVAIDGYHFDTAYQVALRAAGRKTLVMDDINDRCEYAADILLNQNPEARDIRYSVNPDCLQLRGTDYALLRREFAKFPRNDRPTPESASRLLITLGGADPTNLTSKVVRAMAGRNDPSFQVTIVAGAANPHIRDIQKAADELACPVTLLTDVADMAELMHQADLAITAAGSTCWELCFFGVPMLLFVVADNQEGIGRALTSEGAALRFDTDAPAGEIIAELRRLCADSPARDAMRTCGRRLIDGRGAARVADALRRPILRLRPAGPDDSDLLLAWRNAPSARANSFTTGIIAPEEHRAWFDKKLADDTTMLLVAEDTAGKPVGQIRLELDGSEAVISLSVSPDAMGRGIGTAMTMAACKRLASTWPRAIAVALVKPDNTASARMFRKAGFVQTTPSDPDHLRFEWSQGDHE
jgi:UDP-2,4-diacetamido-2,4,6-trideoxy-beta-L-altropyranose hydrolase